jgi:predicted nucleic acid-binding protein
LNRFVLDTSVALAWCFEDETSPATDRVLDLMASSEALVPVIWSIEVGNALLVAERRRRITAAGVSRSLELLRSLNISVDQAPSQKDVDDWITLARARNLSVYDAAYLALAMREGVSLATLDAALMRAARATGVKLAAR